MTREEAIKKLQKQKAEYLDEWVDFSGIAEAYDMAIEALSAEAVQGEWIEHKWAEECDGLLISNYECTNCHSWERNNTDFCPSCGARMTPYKGGEDE